MNWLIQGLGFLGMGLNIVSYQAKRPQTITLIMLLGSTLFAVHFGLLGAYSGMLANIISAARNLYFTKANRTPKAAFYVMAALSLASYAAAFAVFGKSPTLRNVILEVLPCVGCIALSYGMVRRTGNTIRLMGYISSPAWLIYNIFNFSVGGILCEVITLVSITVGLLRFRRNTDPPAENR